MKAIMVMFDSLNRRMLPPYGCDWVHAPNFQRLAERSVTFENCYAGSMACMPARRELHTGRYNFLHRSWGPLEPFDERDSVFARARLEPGSKRFDRYYAAHPGKLATDERSRALPKLASPGSRRYRPAEAALAEAQFAASDLFAAAVERADASAPTGTPNSLGVSDLGDAPMRLADDSPAALTRFVKDAARFLGADDVGVAPLDPAFAYSHRGRPLSRYGEAVQLGHGHAVVMVFRMRHEYLRAAPEMIGTAETARVYQQARPVCRPPK